MNKTYLSKPKYCKAHQCNKILWLDKNIPEETVEKANESILETGTAVGELASGYFGEYTNIEFDKDISKTCANTELTLDKKANIMYINSEYVRRGNLDLKQLFIIEDITDIAFSKQEEIENKIKEINTYMESVEEPKKEISMNCFKPYECSYWEYCTRNLPEKNIFNIKGGIHLDKKFECYNKGIIEYQDIVNSDINSKYIQQAEVDLNNDVIINKEEIRKGLLEYCKLDTYAMVKVWERLKEV